MTALVEAAHGASSTRGSYLRDKLHRLKARRGYQRAAVAIAHKILTAVYVMLSTRADYRDLGATYLDSIDAQRVKPISSAVSSDSAMRSPPRSALTRVARWARGPRAGPGVILIAEPSESPTRTADTTYGKRALAGGFGGSGCAPPMPAVFEPVAGTEPERSGGGVRLMLNLVTY